MDYWQIGVKLGFDRGSAATISCTLRHALSYPSFCLPTFPPTFHPQSMSLFSPILGVWRRPRYPTYAHTYEEDVHVLSDCISVGMGSALPVATMDVMVRLLLGGRYIQKASQKVWQPIYDLPSKNGIGQAFWAGTWYKMSILYLSFGPPHLQPPEEKSGLVWRKKCDSAPDYVPGAPNPKH